MSTPIPSATEAGLLGFALADTLVDLLVLPDADAG